jgi:hypothetical protein
MPPKFPVPWDKPCIYKWNGNDLYATFEKYVNQNPWLCRLLDSNFLEQRPLAGVYDSCRLQSLLDQWFLEICNNYYQGSALWNNCLFQEYLFGSIVARVLLRHYLYELIAEDRYGSFKPGDAFWPPAYYLVRGTRIFDWANGSPQMEFFQPGTWGTRHTATVVDACYCPQGLFRWYLLLPMTTSGSGIQVDWRRVVPDWWVQITDGMLSRRASRLWTVPQQIIQDAHEVCRHDFRSSNSCKTQRDLQNFLQGQYLAAQQNVLVLHVLHCGRCLAVLQDIFSSGALTPTPSSGGTLTSRPRRRRMLRPPQRFVRWQSFLRSVSPAHPEVAPGQLWTTRLEKLRYPGHEGDGELTVFDLQSLPHSVVVLEVVGRVGEWTEIRVAPVSLAVEMAMEMEGDVVVKAGEFPAGVPFMVEVWNEQAMLAENLDVCLGTLSDGVMGRIQGLRDRFRPLSYREVVLRGLDADPKWRFRAEEYEETAYLREPAEAARAAVVERPVPLPEWLRRVLDSLRGVVVTWAWGEVEPAWAWAAAPEGGGRVVEVRSPDGRVWGEVAVGSGREVTLRVETGDEGLRGRRVKVWLGGKEVGEWELVDWGEGRYGCEGWLGLWEGEGTLEVALAVVEEETG